MVGPEAGGGWGVSVSWRQSFSLGKGESPGDYGGCTTMWMCLMPLGCVLKNGENAKFNVMHISPQGLLRWLSGKESTYQGRRHGRCWFHPYVRKIPWRRKWQPTPVGWKFHGQKNLVGDSPWDCKESGTTEWVSTEADLIGRPLRWFQMTPTS